MDIGNGAGLLGVAGIAILFFASIMRQGARPHHERRRRRSARDPREELIAEMRDDNARLYRELLQAQAEARETARILAEEIARRKGYEAANSDASRRPHIPADVRSAMDRLGLDAEDPGIDEEKIIAAARLALKRHHPDVGGSVDALRQSIADRDLCLGWVRRGT